LLPVRLPIPRDVGRGSVSLTFTAPPPVPGRINVIPVDLQRFRLATGAAAYVDFKSIPYADSEVLEWFRRMNKAEAWYEAGDWRHDELAREGITHVIVPADRPRPPGRFKLQFEDANYLLYRIE
jgi:hypothetical protein